MFPKRSCSKGPKRYCPEGRFTGLFRQVLLSQLVALGLGKVREGTV